MTCSLEIVTGLQPQVAQRRRKIGRGVGGHHRIGI
jgi:hypothetical protein